MPSSHARHYSSTRQQHSPLQQCAELQAALLGNTAVIQDQDVLLRLLQSCKVLQAEAARQCAGQMTAVLRTQSMEHAIAFASWLQRHAVLLQGLELQLSNGHGFCLREGPAVSALAGTMLQQQQHMQGLQHFTMKSSFWPAGIVQHLPTSLTMLDLSGAYAARYEGEHILKPIARLQQLTELRLGAVLPSQLLAAKLPPLLQHLDVTVNVVYDHKELLRLAKWLQLHGRIIRCLGLSNLSARLAHRSWFHLDKKLWNEAMEAIAEGVKAAPAPQPVAAAAAPDKAGQPTASSTVKAATPHNVGTAPYSSWKMQALSCHPLGGAFRAVPLPGALLKQLPAATLSRLVCSLEFKNPKHLAALCGLTALRSLEVLPQLQDGADLADCSSRALSPLSALQQLTALKLDCVKTCQLAHLQLPQLQRRWCASVGVHVETLQSSGGSDGGGSSSSSNSSNSSSSSSSRRILSSRCRCS